jgi:GNAT superfamily N-acetyltransferase
MPASMRVPLVRDYRSSDRDAVRRICYETGLLGNNVREHYRDFASYADIFTAYYTDREPEHALVAELDGAVVGYVLGCLDTRRASSPLWIALRHALTRGVCFRPGTAAFYWRGLLDSVLDLTKPQRPRFAHDRYPSHLHLNLLPEARGSGTSTRLFHSLFDRLRRAGSAGVFAEVGADNAPMLGASTGRVGFEILDPPYPAPGGRMPDGRRMWLRLLVRDLSRWVPGAWQAPGA